MASSSPEMIIAEARSTAEKLIEAARGTVEAIIEAVRDIDNSSSPAALAPKLCSLTPLSKTRDFFDHSSYIIRECLPSVALDHIWLLEIDNPFTLFRDSNLNLAASYIRYYNETRNTHDWIHVMVKAASFKHFIEVMNKDRGETRTLAFSCWCDGGHHVDAWFRQHRHFVVVAPKGHFNTQVWSRVPEFPGIPCKGAKNITNSFHLMNVLGYLSKEKSRCEFTIKTVKGKNPLQKKHFYIFETLPVDFYKPLATQWNNGIFQTLYLEKFQYETIHHLTESSLIFENSQWKIKISDIENVQRNIVLPVAKEYSPTRQETSLYIHLTRGKKLYFQFDPENENLNERDWLQKQVRGGNVFYNIIDNEKWIPPEEYQKQLNFLMPWLEKIKKLEKENFYLKEKIESLKEKKNESF